MYHVSRNVISSCILAIFLYALAAPAIVCASDISIVKNAILSLDKSLTLGKALDSYKYFDERDWSIKKDDRGRRYVEFRARYVNKYIINDISNELSNAVKDFTNHSDEFSKFLDANKFKLEFVAQFFITADNKDFEISYLGFEANNISEKANQSSMEVYIKRIFRNESLKYTTQRHKFHMPQEPIQYYFKKLAIQKIDKKLLSFAATSVPAWEYLDEAHKPIAVYKLNDFIFDDSTHTITAKVDYIITDLNKAGSKLTSNMDNNKELLSEISKLKEPYNILQKGSMTLKQRREDNYSLLLFEDTGSSGKKGKFSFSIKSLQPIVVNSHSLNIDTFSEQVREFIKTQKESLAAVEQSKRERMREEEAAEYSKSALAQANQARDTPYRATKNIKTEPVKAQTRTDTFLLRTFQVNSGSVTLDICSSETSKCNNFYLSRNSQPYRLFKERKDQFKKGIKFKAEYRTDSLALTTILEPFPFIDQQESSQSETPDDVQTNRYMLCIGKGATLDDACRNISAKEGIAIIIDNIEGNVSANNDPSNSFGDKVALYSVEMLNGYITLLKGGTDEQVDYLQVDGDYLISQENGKLYKFVQ